jgi:hypothetical protein
VTRNHIASRFKTLAPIGVLRLGCGLSTFISGGFVGVFNRANAWQILDIHSRAES